MKNELFVHVGKMIDKELYCQEIAKKEFAYRVEIDRSNLYRILKKASMDTDQLFRFPWSWVTTSSATCRMNST